MNSSEETSTTSLSLSDENKPSQSTRQLKYYYRRKRKPRKSHPFSEQKTPSRQLSYYHRKKNEDKWRSREDQNSEKL